MKHTFIVGLFAFLLASTLFLGINARASAAASHDQSSQIIHSPLASQVGCNGDHTMKVYYYPLSHLCYNGPGYVTVNIFEVSQIYTGDRTASIAWIDGAGGYRSADLSIAHRNYYGYNLSTSGGTLYNLYYIYLY
jgi:hypothetical protein